jgi:hypothetical protein
LSISRHAIAASPGTGGSALKLDSCSVIAIAAQTFAAIGGICSAAIAA